MGTQRAQRNNLKKMIISAQLTVLLATLLGCATKDSPTGAHAPEASRLDGTWQMISYPSVEPSSSLPGGAMQEMVMSIRDGHVRKLTTFRKKGAPPDVFCEIASREVWEIRPESYKVVSMDVEPPKSRGGSSCPPPPNNLSGAEHRYELRGNELKLMWDVKKCEFTTYSNRKSDMVCTDAGTLTWVFRRAHEAQ